MQTYAGIDLHSSNNYIVVIDETDQRLFQKRMQNEIDPIISALDPFKNSLEAVVVESTYNWYWLVDGLADQGYKVHLANPAANKQYEGLKYTDDNWDSYWLAHMKRLGILAEGYIYPREERPIRDMLRRRSMFVEERTRHILSFQSMFTRNLGVKISNNQVKKLKEEDAAKLFESQELSFLAARQIETIRFLAKTAKAIEKEVLSKVKLKEEFKMLNTITGIGNILALTIMLEVGDIGRFATVGDYSSYCRCVDSKRKSNGKKKGENNAKNGNKYLAWAYVEAANFAKRYCKKAQRFYQKKAAKANKALATKALSNKICRASYYVMRDRVPYDPDMLFG